MRKWMDKGRKSGKGMPRAHAGIGGNSKHWPQSQKITKWPHAFMILQMIPEGHIHHNNNNRSQVKPSRRFAWLPAWKLIRPILRAPGPARGEYEQRAVVLRCIHENNSCIQSGHGSSHWLFPATKLAGPLPKVSWNPSTCHSGTSFVLQFQPVLQFFMQLIQGTTKWK